MCWLYCQMMSSFCSLYICKMMVMLYIELLGFRVSNATFNAIVMRYSDKDGHIVFDDFVSLYIKLKTLFGQLLYYISRHILFWFVGYLPIPPKLKPLPNHPSRPHNYFHHRYSGTHRSNALVIHPACFTGGLLY